MYMMAAWLGAAAVLFHVAARAFDWPDFWKGFPIGVLLIALTLLLRRKLRDEYTERLWNAGTSLAFVVLVVWFLFAPFAEGFFDGLLHGPAVLQVPDIAAPLALFAFFAGFLATWVRDRL